MDMKKIPSLLALLTAVACVSAAMAQPAAWSQSTKPFRIVDNIYYVGTKGLASYLIVSDGKAILLDGTLAGNAGLIEKNIRALGFRLSDVRIILNSHAHYDHAAGIAKLKAEKVPFLKNVFRIGDTRAVTIEGPSHEAIELVETK